MRPRALVLIIILAILPLAISSVATPFPETIRTFSTETFKPFFQTSDFFSDSFRGMFTKTKDIFSIYRQNQELKNQVAVMKIEISQLKEVNQQVARLEKLIPLINKYPKKIAVGQIIFRGISFWEQNVVIDKGKKQGIQKNMAVATEQGLVGRVSSISDSTAQIILLTDYTSSVSVIGQESRDIGLISGEGQNLLKMKFIDISSTIKVGDSIVTSGMGGVFPKGIPVGKVEVVGKDRNGLHLFALVKTYVNFSKLEEVLCLDRSLKEPEFSVE